MTDLTDAGKARLEDYLERVGEVLGDARRRASFATYALGLLSDVERKSVEPIAARAAANEKVVDALHQRLLHFITDSTWDDRTVRLFAARYALEAMPANEDVEAWILDDTGFLKQGKHSVGVQRQYTSLRRQGHQLPGGRVAHHRHAQRPPPGGLRTLRAEAMDRRRCAPRRGAQPGGRRLPDEARAGPRDGGARAG